MSLLATSAPPDALSLLADRLDPPKVDVFGLLGYTPTERQAEFHAATEFDVLYGGAAGGGKSRALVMEAIRACVEHPGIRVGAFRRTFDELEESLLKEVYGVLGLLEEQFGCRLVKSPKPDLRFRNGSVIRFRYLDSLKSATRRQGGEYQLVVFDELTLLPPAAVSVVRDERVRSGDEDTLPVLGIRSGSNPGDVGHGAVKARYIVPTNYGTDAITDDFGRTVRFIPAKVSDNPHLNAAYRQSLESIPDPTRRKAMLDGDWDSFAGQYFPEWSHALHVVRPCEIPNVKHRIAGIDWGFAAPWAVLWGARDGEGRVWVYRELYDTHVGESDQAKRITAADAKDGIRLRVADPSMWNTRGDAHTLADMYAANGCVITKAENHRISGWQRVHSYLELGPACHIHAAQGLDECPMLHVFDTCANLIRTLPDQVHDLKVVEDLDTEGEDHAADALRYLLMAMGLRPPRKPAVPLDISPEARAARHIEHLAKTRKRSKGRPVGM